jgi:hypothetical protein
MVNLHNSLIINTLEQTPLIINKLHIIKTNM